jgi:hypothetical protein
MNERKTKQALPIRILSPYFNPVLLHYYSSGAVSST